MINTTDQNQTVNRETVFDFREALFNAGEVGPANKIQKPLELITSLRGIVFDIDPGLFRINGPFGNTTCDPTRFYNEVIASWLGRHPTLAKAQVRMSGTGLHVLLLFDAPIAFINAEDRERWAAVTKVVQASLPIDPNQPGITAITRPIGATNSKNGATVTQLSAGQLISQAEIVELCDSMMDQPFRVVAGILFGGDRISPCPICSGVDSTLAVYSQSGHCYRSCGKVKLQHLLDAVYAPAEEAR